MKARIYQFLILMLQFSCGSLVVEFEWNSIEEIVFIVLPISIVGGILFTLYDKEIKEQ